jgi:hypothetical protein
MQGFIHTFVAGKLAMFASSAHQKPLFYIIPFSISDILL